MFEITTEGQLRTKAALDHEATSVHLLTVGVTDGKDANGNADNALDDTDTVTVTVDDVNETPSLTGQPSITLPEGAVTFVGNYLADDQDSGDSIAWSLAGTDAGDFAIENGILSFRENPDFESPADSGRNSVYNVVVRVSDGKNRDGQTDTRIDATLTVSVSVSVSNEEEAGTLTLLSNQPQVDTALNATLTDPDGGLTGISWQWQVRDTGAWSNIAGATSARYTPVAADEDKRLRVTASYRDGHGSGKTATAELPNAVQTAPAANTPPEFPTTSTTRSVDENTAADRDIGVPVAATDNDRLTYTLGGTDAASFSIDQNTGQLRSDATLDYEKRSSYLVTVTATDPSLAFRSIAVTINVTDLNEPPAFPQSLRAPLSVDENTDAERNIGSPLTAIDEDDGDSLTYSLDSASAAVFDIDPDKGLLRTEAPLDHETADSYRVVVQVSDGDGDDDDDKPDPAIDDTVTLTVRVNDRNEPPAVSGETSISYAEDRTDLVATYDHNDPDENASITWSLSGPDAGDFAIDASGVLSFAGPPDHDDPRDHESDNEYHVTVTASDGSLRDSLRDSLDVTVTVTVTGVNEGPDVSGPQNPSYAEHGTQPVATYADNDPEDDDIEWSLSGDDAGDFEISMDGVLDFREAPDHEHPRDANGDNEYHVNVTAFDGALDDSLVVTVTVTDVNEPPTLTGDFQVSAPEHGDLLLTRYTASDPERGPLTWFLSGSDDDNFELTDDGDLRFLAEPDFERPADRNGDNIYQLGIWVTDGHNTPSREVFVTVTNVDERGSIALTSVQPQVGTPLAATLSDPDGGVRAVS